MSLEQRLAGWVDPSSDTEQDRQDRTERMVREAIKAHAPFNECDLRVFAKGSYANNTNVQIDSDVDIAVECTEAVYWDESEPGLHTPTGKYAGVWTPTKLRQELDTALAVKFPGDVDITGTTAIRVHSNSARVDADVVPCFTFQYYQPGGACRAGTKIFRKDGSSLVNYPEQQLLKGREKNNRTRYAYKKAVRILKRIENSMVQAGETDAVASFFIECLAYNCPDSVFLMPTWTETVRGALFHIWDSLQGDEPTISEQRWREVNECFYLFHTRQKWTREQGRTFARASWNHLGLS